MGKKEMKRITSIVFLVCCQISAAAESSWSLISVEEMSKYAGDESSVSLSIRAVPDPAAPEIIVHSPDASRDLTSPTDIKVSFRASAGARVRPETFRVKYGALGLDVTDRIVSRFPPNESGLNVANAELPTGNHVFVLSISDSLGRISVRRLAVKVIKGR